LQGVSNSSKGYRVCDLCFNEILLMPKFTIINDDLKKMEAAREEIDEVDEESTVVEDKKSSSEKILPPAKNTKLTRLEKRMLREKKPQTPEERAAFRSAVKKKYNYKEKDSQQSNILGSSKKLMSENKNLAVARGKELQETEEKAADMADAATSFADTAKRIRQQQQRRWI